jgi:hypothetical protein
MINSIFFGYLSPQWKRLVRTIVILNLIFWVMIVILDGDPDFVAVIIILTIVNLVLSYVSELFVKIKQENEVGLSILCLLINIILTILFFEG